MQKWADVFNDIKTFGAKVTVNLIKNYTKIDGLKDIILKEVMRDRFE